MSLPEMHHDRYIFLFPVSLKVIYVYQELHTKSINALFWMYFGGIYFIAQLLAIH